MAHDHFSTLPPGGAVHGRRGSGLNQPYSYPDQPALAIPGVLLARILRQMRRYVCLDELG